MIVRLAWIGAAIVALAGARASGDELLPSARERFAVPTGETPGFRRHVVPLLGRLGCNGRACHGSFQGQGGFRLSLFGYDFEADLASLAGPERPRVDRENPPASLILRKPTLEIDHEGGDRFPRDGWQHRLLLRWIQAGAADGESERLELAALEVEPREIVFTAAGQKQSMRVVARWAGGVREDVTALCRFRSNDESIATIDAEGVVTAGSSGDTHVVAFYDNGVAPVPVLRPWSELVGPRFPDVPTPTRIDELVVAKLRKLGVVPSGPCSDAEFLRRASLDMTGTLPLPDEVTAFVADASPNKRTQKIDELLGRPTYAAWWATRLGDFTGNSEQLGPDGSERGLRREFSEQWYDWLHRRVRENVPYDKIVEGIVVATSRRPGQSDDEYFAEMSSYVRQNDRGDFSARETMPHFWSRGRFASPVALRFSYSFLGARLECAECHKHPFDQWTRQDYDQFKAFFDGVRYNSLTRERARTLLVELGLTADQDSGQFQRAYGDLARAGTVVPWKEVVVPAAGKSGKPSRAKTPTGRVITPRLLGGEEVLATEYDDPRRPLIDWMRRPDNPYFARAFVNRVWASYFHMGIVEPPDDLNLANPPSNEPLLDYLAAAFVESGYDMKWLHREIAASRAYQASWRPNDTNRLDSRNFSRAVPRRLPAEVTYDALVLATAGEAAAREMVEAPRARAIGVSSGFARQPAAYAMATFGKPVRAAICDCERANDPTLLQALYLRNDDEVMDLLNRKDGWLARLNPASDRDGIIRQAYLRTVSRLPDEGELAIGRRHLEAAPDVLTGVRDLLWALVNTKEFIVNH
jgi:hypothetical protein